MDCNGDDPCLPDVPFNDVIIYNNPLTNIKEYYAATDAGVFVSSGESLWHELFGGLPNSIVMDIEIVQNKLRAATFGRGIFEWDLSASPSQQKAIIKNNKTQFLRVFNYPNPFNPSTEISITLSAASHVKLTVYDILGRQIDILVDKMLEPSDYKFKWNGEKYTSGVYFYRIESNGFKETKKMLLLK
jgi:hypothetical protein